VHNYLNQVQNSRFEPGTGDYFHKVIDKQKFRSAKSLTGILFFKLNFT
jgi:hypothetical protein